MEFISYALAAVAVTIGCGAWHNMELTTAIIDKMQYMVMAVSG